MRFKGKITALILSLTTVFTTFFSIPAHAHLPFIGQGYVSRYGYNVPTTKDFMDSLLVFGKLYEILTGMKIFSDDKINVVVEGYLKDVYDEVYTLSDGTMDFELFFKSLPISSDRAKRFYKLTRLDKDEVVAYLTQKNHEAEENNDPMAIVYFFMRVYMNIFDDVVIGVAPLGGQDGLYEVVVTVYYTDGTSEEMTPGVYYDANRDFLYGKDGKGIFNLSYDLDVANATLICVQDAWQRNFGFCLFYDIVSYATPFFDYNTQRIKFTYDNKDWMIQLWKGRYIITSGCEVGVYTRDKYSVGTYYNCASDGDMLLISMDLYHGDDFIVSVPTTLHWWLTAFRFTPKCYLPESLTMYSTITFKDEEMAELFVKSAGWCREIKDVVRDGASVSFKW